MPQRIYLAGPLFMPYERQFISELAARLREMGHELFVPHENKWPGQLTPQIVFEKDMSGLAPATVIVAIVDGVQVDDGTAAEIGIFWGMAQHDASKQKIIALCTDSRRIRKRDEGQPLDLNLFVEGCIRDKGVIVHSVEEVVAELQKLEV